METTTQRPRVGLFVTCLVDMFRPQVGFAAIELLEQSGCDVVVPDQQTCCGQPAMNAGATDIAAGLAKQVISHFEAFDYVVVPSGSCAAMIKVHFVEALAGDHDWTRRASALAEKTWELLSFLTDVRGYTPQGVSLQTTVVV
ncbi:MAG: (Fe-S)-binding protein, partial [Pseudomonadota bacterium]